MDFANEGITELFLKKEVSVATFLMILFLGALLFVISTNYLILHGILEYLIIISGFVISFTAYKRYKRQYHDGLVFLIITYTLIPILYLFHRLSMGQVGLLLSITQDQSIGFLISGRFIESINFLFIGLLFLGEKDIKKEVFRYGLLSFLLLISSLHLGVVMKFIQPDMTIALGYKVLKTIISIIFLMNILVFVRNKDYIHQDILAPLIVAMYIAALGEIMPVFFNTHFFFYSSLGKVLNLASYCFIFKVLTVEDYKQPQKIARQPYRCRFLKNSFNNKNEQDYLQQQEVILQKVINSLVEAIVVIDNEGKIIHYNTKCVELFTIPSFILQKRDVRIIYDYIQPLFVEAHKFNKKLKEAYLYNEDIFEEVFLKDGRCLKVYLTSFEVYNTKGWVVSLEDITVDKRQRILIEESQRNYEKLLNSIPHAMILRKDMTCIYANEAAANLFGYHHQEDLVGVNLKEILPDNYPECLGDSYVDGCLKNAAEIQVVDKSGKKRWAKVVSCSDYHDDSTKLMTFEDITSNKSTIEMEKRMKENERILEKQRVENQFKIDFYTSFSHELKTPINIISAVGHMLKKELKEDSSKALKYIETLNVNCNRLIRNINNSIDINKLETGFYQLNKQYCNIVNIVEDVVQSAMPYMEEKNIQCIFDTNEEEIYTRIDINSMERVILNLLSNAIKFTPPKGEIIVTVSKLGRDFRIMVQDSGIGIEKEKFRKIFKRYEQENRSLEHNPRGSGIGLYLTKNLIEMHGGRIIVDSVVGKGSTFKTILPIEEMKSMDHLVDYEALTTNRLDPKEIVNVEMSELGF